MQKKLLFIVNPKAGRTRSAAPLFEAAALFGEAGWLLSIRRTQRPGHAVEIVTAEGGDYDAIVCCGGDGTLNEVVRGAMSLPAPPSIGYIPGGSTNDFAASLELSQDPVQTAERILSSPGRTMDVGTFNGRPFIYVASFGAFTKASYSAPQNVKNDLGHLAYILEGLKDLGSLRPYRATVTTEEEVFDGEFLFGAVTNATSVGGIMKLPKELVSMDDGRSELLLIPNPATPAELQSLVLSLVLQDFTGGGVIFRHVSSVTVQTPEAFPWTLDGEYAPGGPQAEIRNAPRRLTFLL